MGLTLSVANGANGSNPQPLTIAIPAGAAVCLLASFNAGSGQTYHQGSVSDGANTYTPAGGSNIGQAGGQYDDAFYCLNTSSSATTITYTPNASYTSMGNVGITVWVWTVTGGTVTFGSFSDNVQSAPGTGADAITSGAVTCAAGSVVMGHTRDNGAGAVTAGTSFIQDYNAFNILIGEHISASSNQAATWTTATGADTPIISLALSFGISAGNVPTVVSQVQNSSAATVTSLAAPAITPTVADSLAVFILTTASSGVTLSDAGVGNVYQHVGQGNSGSFWLSAYLAQNVVASPTTITASTGAAALYAIAVVDVNKCAINNGALGFNVHAQTGSGTAGANLIFSNTIPLANPALMLAINVDLGLLGACTAGTSPIAFTGQTPIWATFGGGIAVAVIESALINSTQQATYGSTAANKSDNFLTLAMDIGYFLSFTLQPFTPVQFFVTNTVIQM